MLKSYKSNGNPDNIHNYFTIWDSMYAMEFKIIFVSPCVMWHSFSVVEWHMKLEIPYNTHKSRQHIGIPHANVKFKARMEFHVSYVTPYTVQLTGNTPWQNNLTCLTLQCLHLLENKHKLSQMCQNRHLDGFFEVLKTSKLFKICLYFFPFQRLLFEVYCRKDFGKFSALKN